MRTNSFVFVLAFLISAACNSAKPQQPNGDSVSPEAVELNNKALHLFQEARGDSMKLTEAMELWKKSAAIDSTNFITLSNMRMCAHALKDYQTALELSQRMLVLRPQYPDVMGMVGADHEFNGDSAVAWDYYLKSLQRTEEILDTMSSTHHEKLTLEINRVTMLIMLKRNNAADSALKNTIAGLKGQDTVYRSLLSDFIGKTKEEILQPEGRW